MMTKVAYLILAAIAFTSAVFVQFSQVASAEPNDGRVVTIEFVWRCEAEAPGKLDLEAAEMVAELIGAPVFAAGGLEIGSVADISFDEGRPQRLRVTIEANLGFGTRTVNVPNGTFMALRGAVVLDLNPEQVRQLPDAGDHKLR